MSFDLDAMVAEYQESQDLPKDAKDSFVETATEMLEKWKEATTEVVGEDQAEGMLKEMWAILTNKGLPSPRGYTPRMKSFRSPEERMKQLDEATREEVAKVSENKLKRMSVSALKTWCKEHDINMIGIARKEDADIKNLLIERIVNEYKPVAS